ncbi:hypothetical protein MKX08_010439 [Trichoderma sp. CBMAI-0020]|nr:hypothetical protein MKX08_010439 [Trichoderma sp. CBMAI-0020]
MIYILQRKRREAAQEQGKKERRERRGATKVQDDKSQKLKELQRRLRLNTTRVKYQPLIRPGGFQPSAKGALAPQPYGIVGMAPGEGLSPPSHVGISSQRRGGHRGCARDKVSICSGPANERRFTIDNV